MALRKVFSRESIPFALVTDNGSHFITGNLESWFKSLRCHQLLTAPGHPQSNGSAKNCVKTLQSAIQSSSPNSFLQLDQCIDNFLMQYRNAEHTVMKKSPSTLFKNRTLRICLNCIKSSDVTYFKENDLKPRNCVEAAGKSYGFYSRQMISQVTGDIWNRYVLMVPLSLFQSILCAQILMMFLIREMTINRLKNLSNS